MTRMNNHIKSFDEFLNEWFSDCSIEGMDVEDRKEHQQKIEIPKLTLEQLKEKYPNAIITMEPWREFGDRYFARVDIMTQGGEKEYLGALKGPVSEQTAVEFFNNVLYKKYDGYY